MGILGYLPTWMLNMVCSPTTKVTEWRNSDDAVNDALGGSIISSMESVRVPVGISFWFIGKG